MEYSIQNFVERSTQRMSQICKTINFEINQTNKRNIGAERIELIDSLIHVLNNELKLLKDVKGEKVYTETINFIHERHFKEDSILKLTNENRLNLSYFQLSNFALILFANKTK